MNQHWHDLKTDPKVLEALVRATSYVMSPEELHAQRHSWVVGEMMLMYPEMTREEADRIVSQATGYPAVPAFAAANPSGGWRPIENMPKNGMFIVTNAIGEVCPIQVRDGQGIISNHPGFADWTWGQMATLWQPLPEPPGALAGEAGTAETEGLGPKDDHAASSEATPSLPLPNFPKGQEETSCPMTVEEAREVLASLPKYAKPQEWAALNRKLASGNCAGDEMRRLHDCYRNEADRIELALSTIRASEEDR